MSCKAELSNMYMHCVGCELILHKDFNLCVDCFKMRKGDVLHKHSSESPNFPTLITLDISNAMDPARGRRGNRAAASSNHANYVVAAHCSCTCRSIYQMRCRFNSPGEMADLSMKAQQTVVVNQINYILPEYVVLRRILEEAQEFDPANPRSDRVSSEPLNLLPAWVCSECQFRNKKGMWYCQGDDKRRPLLRCNKKLLSVIHHDIASFHRYGYFPTLVLKYK